MASLLGITVELALADADVFEADFEAEVEASELPEAREWDCVRVPTTLEPTAVSADSKGSTRSRLSGHKTCDPEQ